MYVNVYIHVKKAPLCVSPRRGESHATPLDVRLWTFFLAPVGGKMSVGQKGGFFSSICLLTEDNLKNNTSIIIHSK